MQQERSKLAFTITAIITAIVVSLGVSRLMQPKETNLSPSQDANFEAEMQKIAAGINIKCPTMIDPTTRLDNVSVLPGKVFQYNYTLLNVEATEANPEEMKKYIEPRILANIKTNPDLEVQRKNKVTMGYLYKDKGGTPLFRVEITPAMYQQ